MNMIFFSKKKKKPKVYVKELNFLTLNTGLFQDQDQLSTAYVEKLDTF